MEHFGLEYYFWGLVGIVLSEEYFEDEDAAFPDGVDRAKNDSVPLVNVILVGYCFNFLLVLFLHLLEILNQSSFGDSGHAYICI